MLERDAHPHLAAREQVPAGVDDVLREPLLGENAAHEVDEIALAHRSDVEQHRRHGLEVLAIPGDRVVPRRHDLADGCGAQAIAAVVAERLESASDQGRDAASGHLVELAVELEQRAGIIRKPVATRLARHPDDEGVLPES